MSIEKIRKINISGTQLTPIPCVGSSRKAEKTKEIIQEISRPRIKILIFNRNPIKKVKNIETKREVGNIKGKAGRSNEKIVKGRIGNYQRLLPKIQDYKPLFHDRNKSYNLFHDDEEEHNYLRNRISWLDY